MFPEAGWEIFGGVWESRSSQSTAECGREILGAVTLGSKAQHSFVIVLDTVFSHLPSSPHGFQVNYPPTPPHKGPLFLSFYEDDKRIELSLNSASTFLCAIIWTLTIKPLKIALDVTGHSSLQWNLKRLAVWFLKYLSHKDRVNSACLFYVL